MLRLRVRLCVASDSSKIAISMQIDAPDDYIFVVLQML